MVIVKTEIKLTKTCFTKSFQHFFALVRDDAQWQFVTRRVSIPRSAA